MDPTPALQTDSTLRGIKIKMLMESGEALWEIEKIGGEGTSNLPLGSTTNYQELKEILLEPKKESPRARDAIYWMTLSAYSNPRVSYNYARSPRWWVRCFANDSNKTRIHICAWLSMSVRIELRLPQVYQRGYGLANRSW